jgi:hypothetical protein
MYVAAVLTGRLFAPDASEGLLCCMGGVVEAPAHFDPHACSTGAVWLLLLKFAAHMLNCCPT